MPYFNLKIVDTGEILSDATAVNSFAALEVFGAKIGIKLTFDTQDRASPYLFEEWQDSPHWVNPSVPVYEA